MQAEATDKAIESLVRRDRLVVAASLALLAILAWTYTVLMALPGSEVNQHGGMHAMAGMAGMATGAWRPWTATEAAFMFAMWIVMMAAMMIPSAAPMVLAFARISRARAPTPGCHTCPKIGIGVDWCLTTRSPTTSYSAASITSHRAA